MTKRKRHSVIASDSDSEGDTFQAAKKTKKEQKDKKDKQPAKKKRKQAETVFVESDGESPSPSKSAKQQQQQPSKKSAKSPKVTQKNTLDNYFSRKEPAPAARAKEAKNPPAAPAAGSSGVKISPDDFFHAKAQADDSKRKSTAAASAAADSDPDIVETSFSGPPPERRSPRKSGAKLPPARQKSVESPRKSVAARASTNDNEAASATKRQNEAKPAANQSDAKLAANQSGAKASAKDTALRASTNQSSAPQPAGQHSAAKPSANHDSPPAKSPLKKTVTPEAKRASYLAYLHRDGPKHLGEIQLPAGKPGCLQGQTIVLTGVMDYAEKEAIESLLQLCGAKVTKSVSKRTSLLVVGREPGAAKTEKAGQLGIRQLGEREFYEFLRQKSGQPQQQQQQQQQVKEQVKEQVKQQVEQQVKQQVEEEVKGQQQQQMWVDKYRPRSLKQVIGQSGPGSSAAKLVAWLSEWQRHLASGAKKGTAQAYQRWNDDGSSLKAALLSGPPGVGKTTTATLACAELGLRTVELNASDTRNKRSLQEQLGHALGTQAVDGMLSSQDGCRRCVIMDEVDGMAGTEDRGGVAELIQLIRTSRVPIICICNDRQHQKMRSLANYCYDLRFARPRPEQIKAALLSIAFKEGVKVDPQGLLEVIAASSNDVRQTIHNVQAWSAGGRASDAEQLHRDASRSQKDLRYGPFDLVRKALSADEQEGRSLNAKADLFFQDYSMEPLFVQENYPLLEPRAVRNAAPRRRDAERLRLLSLAADDIAVGDICGRRIRTTGSWGLMPAQAAFSSVLPAHAVCGTFTQQIHFPQWLGRNSTAGKFSRQLSQLSCHLRLATGGIGSTELCLHLLPALAASLTRPLLLNGSDGVEAVIHMLDAYDLLKDDMDAVLEMTAWPGSADPMAAVDSKVKAALTRQYNKHSHLTHYSLAQAAPKRRAAAAASAVDEFGEPLEDQQLQEEDGEGEEEEEEDAANDAMIKKPKAKAKPKAATDNKAKAKATDNKAKAADSKAKAKATSKKAAAAAAGDSKKAGGSRKRK